MEIRTLIVPCDFSASARAAFDFARGLAHRTGARLCLAHAYFVPLDLEALAVVGAEPVFERIEKQGREQLETWADGARREGLECEVDARRGAPEEVILSIAGERNADLIVMGSTGRTGLAHLVLGSRAERVLRMARCPVITVAARATEPES